MPFTMNAVGRLAHEPTLNVGRGQPWTEFRLLDNRMSRGEKITEAVTFVAFGELAESFCQRAEKGQMIFAWGRQETDRYSDRAGQERTRVRYVMFHFETGPPPARRDPADAPRKAARQPAPPNNTRPPPVDAEDDSDPGGGII